MTRMTPFSSPLLLGFDADGKNAGDGWPRSATAIRPTTSSEFAGGDGAAERLRITLAVAGFCDSDLEVTTEENQLIVRGRQNDDTRA